MASSPKSLQESCMIVVIKHGLSREDLPEIVKAEVQHFEKCIMSAFTGKFYTYKRESTYNYYINYSLAVSLVGGWKTSSNFPRFQTTDRLTANESLM